MGWKSLLGEGCRCQLDSLPSRPSASGYVCSETVSRSSLQAALCRRELPPRQPNGKDVAQPVKTPALLRVLDKQRTPNPQTTRPEPGAPLCVAGLWEQGHARSDGT